MPRPLRTRLVPALAALSFLACPVGAQDYFTPFGSGCAGGTGSVPAIGLSGTTALGRTFTVDLHSAPPFVPAALAIGVSNQVWLGLPLPLDLTQLGFPGCTLWISPDITVSLATDSTGSARVPATLPTAPALLGASFYNQWVVLTPAASLAFSDGGCGTVSNHPPVRFVSVSPPGGPVGTVVTVRTRDLFTPGPTDLCIRIMDPRGDTSLLSATSITLDPATGEDVITATLETASLLLPPVAGDVGIMRGRGMRPTLTPSSSLTPTHSWAWNSLQLLGEATSGGSFTPLPATHLATSDFVLVAGGAEAGIPIDPLGNGGVYDPGLRIRIEVHIHYSNCRWFDIVIDLGTTRGLLASALAREIGPGHLQDALDQLLGTGEALVVANGPSIQIHSLNPAVPFDTVAGHVLVD